MAGASAASKSGPVVATDAGRTAEPVRLPPQRTRLPGNQALLRLQRKCSCGGKCSSCSSELKLQMRRNPSRRPSIQPKVAVGPVDDPFEREADTVAERVMRMPDPAAPVIPEGPAFSAVPISQIQRACSDCDTHDDEDEGVLRRKAESPGADTETAAEARPSGSHLTQGGFAMPAGVRGFFETRFARDFSPVRIHTGAEAARLNDSLGSYAFTYSNHIWLGQGHSVGPTSLLAHELAHVVQQTAPALKLSSATQQPASLNQDHQGMVRRAITDFWYFEPRDVTGTSTHSEVLPALKRENAGLLDEVPSPISHDGLGDFRNPGRADLYLPTPRRVVGVWFEGHDKPKNLDRRSSLAGVEYAPTYNWRTKTIENLDRAPTSVGIADLKPIGEPASKGVGQVRGYVNGLELVRTEMRRLGTIKTSGTWPAQDGYAKPLTGNSPPNGLKVPSEYSPDNTGGKKRPLVLKSAGLIGRVSDRVAVKKVDIGRLMGRLVVQEDPNHAGIWNHFWVPDWVPVARFPSDLQKLDDRTLNQVIPALTRLPVGEQTKPKNTPLARDRSGVIRRYGAPKGVAVRDTFNYEQWNENLVAMQKEFKAAEANPKTMESAEAVEGTGQAVENLHKAGAGKHLDVPKNAHELQKLKFWMSPAANVLGKFRKWFGGAFVAIAKLFLWGREKFRALIKSHQREPEGAPGGAMGAVAKIIFKVAKFALVTMMPQIADRLWESLTNGVKAKLVSLIPKNIAEIYEEKKAQLEGIVSSLEEIANNDVLQWLKKLVDPVLEILAKLGKVVAVLRKIKEIVDKIKWAMRIINCATAVEGNVAGCVASLIGPLADWLIQKVVENCSVQKTIIPHILKLDILKLDVPNWIADKLIGFGRKVLEPVGLQDILADPAKSQYFSHKEDIPCEEETTPMQRAMDQLALMFGDDEARLYAFAELMNVLGGDDLNNVKPERILDIASMVLLYNITAEQMQAWSRDITKPPKDIPDAFRGTMDEMFRNIASGEPPPKEYDTTLGGSPDDGAGSGKGSGGGVGEGKGAGVGTGDGKGAGAGEGKPGDGKEGPTVLTVPGSRVPMQGSAQGITHEATIEIVGGHSVKDKQGQKVSLTLLGIRAGAKIYTVVTDVAAEVTNVKMEGKKVISIEYKILSPVTFDVSRALEAGNKGETIGCYRLCITAGRTRTFVFEKPPAPKPAEAKQ